MKKRILSALLVCVMLVGLVPMMGTKVNAVNRDIQVYSQWDVDAYGGINSNWLNTSGCGWFTIGHALQWLRIIGKDSESSNAAIRQLYINSGYKDTANNGIGVGLSYVKTVYENFNYAYSTSLDSILNNGGVAVIHQYGHYYLAVEYSSDNQYVHIIDSCIRVPYNNGVQLYKYTNGTYTASSVSDCAVRSDLRWYCTGSPNWEMIRGNSASTTYAGGDYWVPTSEVSGHAEYGLYNTSPQYTYANPQPSGIYYLKNSGVDLYLTVEGGVDANDTNIIVSSFVAGSNAQKVQIDGSTGLMYPQCSNGRVVNAYAWTPVSKTNINLREIDGESSQKFKFEPYNGGYIIHIMSNEDLVLDTDGSNVLLETIKRTSGQIWYLEDASHTVHTYTSAVTAPATCTTDGVLTYTCTGCNDTYTEAIPATGHTFGNWIVVTPASCTAAGEMKRVCSVCNFEEIGTDTGWIETIPEGLSANDVQTKSQYRSADVTWTDMGWTSTQPTESDDLRITDTRTVTDADAYSYQKYFRYTIMQNNLLYSYASDASGRTYQEIKSTDYPDIYFIDTGEYEDGFMICRSYVDSEGKYQFYFDANGNTRNAQTGETTGSYANGSTYWFVGDAVDVPAVTHTEWRYETRSLGEFSDWQDEEIVESDSLLIEERTLYRYVTDTGEHDYTVTVTAPTCTSEGTRTYICSVCGDTYTETIPALGHNHSLINTIAPTCTEGGYTTITCTRCGDSYITSETEPLGHDFGEWTVTTAATCGEAGVETRYCSRCDATETQAIAPTGEHNFVDGICTVCGEVENALKVFVESVSARPGETITLNVNIADNPGVAGAVVWIDFDPDVFDFADPEDPESCIYTDRTGARLSLLTTNVNTPGRIGIVFGQAANTVRNGALVTIELTVAEEAILGDYEIAVSVTQIKNAAREDVPCVTENGIVSVNNVLYGDADGNGQIDVSDIIVLCQRLLDETLSIGDGADADGNGTLDISDVILICQFLLDETIVLGPQG